MKIIAVILIGWLVWGIYNRVSFGSWGLVGSRQGRSYW
jgi:hypothetical protein